MFQRWCICGQTLVFRALLLLTNVASEAKNKKLEMPSKKKHNTMSTYKFACRLCRGNHGLKHCSRFRNANTIERLGIVKRFGYCNNCLAHSHSQGSCFTTTGCGYCGEKHHSLLHSHVRLKQGLAEGRNKTKAPSEPGMSTSQNGKSPPKSRPDFRPQTTTTSLTAILKQNVATLLPTAVVKIKTKDGEQYVRCLIDSASRMSCISQKSVEKLALTTLELESETICTSTLISVADPSNKIDVTLRVHSRINTTTPKESLPNSLMSCFSNFILADNNFHKAASIDVVLGVDVYSRIIRDGVYVRNGLPTAQSTLFGIIVYGLYSH
ncbi:uncharacterized protein [Musca autumnalis]|uniref:uncharacterized protein n=1 Tax=Musca autumnalis TaxID=221902 RepID=UPI003CEDE616